MLPLSMVLIFNFRIVPTVWYIFVFLVNKKSFSSGRWTFLFTLFYTQIVKNVKCVFMVGFLGCDLRTFQDRKGCDLDFLARTKIFLCGF